MNIVKSESFPVIGIGASAGGLAAFEAFFSGMPVEGDAGMAFVLVQHLAPDHKSLLSDIVRRYTRMEVHEVEDGMTIHPDHVYIIPPNRDMSFLRGQLQLREPAAPRGLRLPIDLFFRSLALDLHERAICVVLSGTGSDGSLGVRAVKDEGGMVMVQTPASAEYDGMPRSAIATGVVDYELPPGEMAARIISYASRTLTEVVPHAEPAVPHYENAHKKIFVLLRTQTGHDFSQYKLSTVDRRIHRRMALHQIDTMDEYIKYAQGMPAEVDALFRDLLIGVTSFFRDPEAFASLEERVIPELFAGKGGEHPVRVWVPACSTGEEAYSIAILLAERQLELKQHFNVQVFATDIDAAAIASARRGVYPASVATDITPGRLARFFTAENAGGMYRINKAVRELVVFSEQDVIRDPPFSRLDLVSCRNLLIYMNADLQKQIIPLFHYATNPGGFLFLGTSETTGEHEELFTSKDRKHKIYQRKGPVYGARHRIKGRPSYTVASPDGLALPAPGKSSLSAKVSMREITEQALLRHVASTAALVSRNGDIQYLYGRTGMFLEPAPGEAGVNNILKMAREGLRNELALALHTSAASASAEVRRGLRVKTNGTFSQVKLAVEPVAGPEGTGAASDLYLVVFDLETDGAAGLHVAIPAASRTVPADPAVTPNEQSVIDGLRQELRTKEAYLQAATEELETSNEELKSSNEELQSINEEMQSTNEELETSKEEIQSANEELSTINAELRTKVADLSRVNNDMSNLLAGTGIGTVFVDLSLNIVRFTPAATKVIHLIESDIGRPISHIASNLESYGDLVADTRSVLDTLVPKELEVSSNDGVWYLLRILPYRTLDNAIEGAVLIFIDISDARKARESLRQAELRIAEVQIAMAEARHGQ